MDPEVPAGRAGDVVIVTFVLAILAFLYILAFFVFTSLRGDDWRVLAAPVARLTHSGFAAVGVLSSLDARRLGHPHWKRYLVAAFIPVVQIGAIVHWFVTRRRLPAQVSEVVKLDTDAYP